MEPIVALKTAAEQKSQPLYDQGTEAPLSLETDLGHSAGIPLFLQRSASLPVQTKLNVSQPNDPDEQEADQIADRVVSPSAPSASPQNCPDCGDLASCPTCQAVQASTQAPISRSIFHSNSDVLSRFADHSTSQPISLSPHLITGDVGRPLDKPLQQKMEQGFGHDFSNIRIHDSTPAETAAAQIDARAFTHKNHIYFGERQFQPQTLDGEKLLAHELTHTIQQSGVSLTSANIQRDQTGPSLQVNPDQVALEIYDALDGWNNEQRAINTLQGRDEGTRRKIQERFQAAHNQSLKSYLREQLDSDWLVKAYALLQSSNWYEQQTAMALALIPLGTRDEEIFRILDGLTLEGRQRLEERYNSTFGEVGNGTEKIGQGSLKGDLKDDLSGWRKEKSLALLNRNLTQADELYFDSVGIVGTHTDSVINRLQMQWSQGPLVLVQLEADWDCYVRNQSNWTDEPWTSMTLYEAMDDELAGESWELVRSTLRGLQRYTNQIGVMVGPLTEEQNRTVEDIQIAVARESLTVATTGGYTGAGTNNEQVYQAISTIQRIYQARIDRDLDPATRERLQQEWNDYRQRELMPIVQSEMDTDTVEYQRTTLLLLGALTPADEVYLAKVEYDTDRTVSLVTRFWAQGQINQLLTGAQQPRRDGDRIVRPAFNTLFLVPVTSGLPYRRIQALIREGVDDTTRGSARLHLELMEGNSDSDLQQAYTLLSTSGATLRSSVVSRYVTHHLSNEIGDSDVRKFIAYIQRRYDRSHTTFEFQDLLDPAATAAEMLTRTEGRYQSAHSGVLDLTLRDWVQNYDTLTGEDTEQVTQESLERLRFIVRSGANQQELQAIMDLAGVTDVNQLARGEYETFRQRLNELRSVRQAIVDGVVIAAQLALETAATILTAGAAGPALLASLSATIAGMVAHELLLGENYELVSRENAEQIALVFASHGFGSLGRSTFVMPSEATRAQAFFYGAAHEAVNQVGTQFVTASFEGRMPTAEGIGISAISILTLSAGAGARNQITHTIGEHATDSQRLRRLVIANIVQNVVSSNTDEATNLARGGTGDLTGSDIAGRFLHSSASGIGRGVVGGIGDFGTHVVERRRQQSQQDAENAPLDRQIDDDIHDPTDRKRLQNSWENHLNPETRRFLHDHSDTAILYRDMNPTVRNLLTHCASICVIPNIRRSQVARVKALLDRIGGEESVLSSGNFTRLRIYFHVAQGDLDIALRWLDNVSTAEALDRTLVQAFRRRAMEPPGGLATSIDPNVVRATLGTVHGGKSLPSVTEPGQWLRNTEGSVGMIPEQVAQQLRGRTFNNFSEFREAFWQAVRHDSVLKQDFNPRNLRSMAGGSSPVAIRTQQEGGQRVYQLHHITPIEHGGGVYDLDNIVVVSPAYHHWIHDEGFGSASPSLLTATRNQ